MIYEKLLNDKLGVNLGYLYENVVAQMLTAKGDQLFYYTSLNPSTRRNYNIDFLLSRKNKICPIEIKPSGYRTHASLDWFPSSDLYFPADLCSKISTIVFSVPTMPGEAICPMLRMVSSGVGPLMP